MNKKKIILNFIRKQYLGVISTVNIQNKPESAVMGFGETNNLELIFGTFNDSRKYKNIKKNPHTSFVIGWEKNITVQYEGKAVELNKTKGKTYKKIYFKKNADAEKFDQFEKQRYFLVKPKWIRYTDFNQEPEKILEINF